MPRSLLRLSLAALLAPLLAPLVAISSPAMAQPADGLIISDAWIRALAKGLPAAGYFTLSNHGDQPMTLTGAASMACGSLTLHQTVEENGTMGTMAAMGGMSAMRQVAEVAVPPHGSLHFAPGGYHLMCEHAGDGVAPGKAIEVTLSFRNGSTLKASFPVKGARDN